MRRLTVLVACVLAAGCAAGGSAGRTSTTTPSGSRKPAATSLVATSPGAFIPEPDAPIPTDAAGLAAALDQVSTALRASIEEWITHGDPSRWPPPSPVVLQALYQQRVYGALAPQPRLARRVIAGLPAELAERTRANVTAGEDLLSLVRPVSHPVSLHTRPPLPAGVLLRYFKEAQRRFGVAWEVLAAVNYIESKFGRVTSASSAGAQGPMQFIPSTWAAYGMGGDVHSARDAIFGAANYLHASGAPSDYWRALYAYNHAWPYVEAVMLYARQMERHPWTFYAYYNWQVFVATQTGDRRLTGPGL